MKDDAAALLAKEPRAFAETEHAHYAGPEDETGRNLGRGVRIAQGRPSIRRSDQDDTQAQMEAAQGC
jgi:hypothetical protein